METIDFEKIVESLDDVAFALDASGCFSYVSPAVEELFGYTPVELIGTPVADLVVPEQAALARDRLTRRAGGEALSEQAEYAVRRKDGVRRWLQLRTRTLHDTDGAFRAFIGVARDVSEHKALEAQLREQAEALESTVARTARELRDVEAQNRTLVDLTTTGIVIFDQRGIRFANRSFAQMVGRSARELVGELLERLLHPDDLIWLEEAYASLETGVSLFAEARLPRGDGEAVWAEIRSTAVEYEGAPAVLANFVDATEARRAAAALKESERRFRELAEMLPQAVFETDLAGTLTFVNQQAYGMFGYTREDFERGVCCFDFLIEADRERAHQNFGVRLRGEPASLAEYTCRRLDGSTFPGLLEASPVLQDGAAVGVRGFIIDISERKAMEESLRAGEEKYRLLVKHAPAGIYEVDLGAGRFISVNDVMCEYTGYTREEFFELSPLMLLTEESQLRFMERQQQVSAGEKVPETVKYQVRAKDGRAYWTVLRTRIFQDESGSPHAMVVAHDVTEIHQLEEQLHQAQRLEALGTLAGGVAHDFNNLLMGIQGRISLLAEEAPSATGREHLDVMEELVRSASELTRQLLGFARSGPYEVKPVALNDLASRCAQMFGRTRRELRLNKRFADDLLTVEVDAGQLDQVLLNLLINAWQAMPDGGEIDLETANETFDEARVKPHGLPAGRFVRLSVTDHGVGMDAATRARVFDPFFTTKQIDRGTGLGLASAYGIVKNHHGFLEVESAEGEGTSFHICLPASDRAVRKRSPSPVDLEVGHETALIVDDEDAVVLVLERMLQRLGYRTLVARSGGEGIEIARAYAGDIQVVILDMVMPDMGGADVFEALREISPEVKVLLSSGYSADAKVTKILSRGGDGFIQKPFTLNEVAKKLREILE